jgi:hypothetical protein
MRFKYNIPYIIMKYKISPRQFNLLTQNFILSEYELHSNGSNLITESMKEFKVRMFFGGWQSEIRIGASSSGSALAIAKLMFPKALVTGSTKQV